MKWRDETRLLGILVWTIILVALVVFAWPDLLAWIGGA